MSVILIEGEGGRPVQLARIAHGGDFPGPIYFCADAHLHPSQPPGSPVMLMEASTWRRVRRADFTHAGAFGSDSASLKVTQVDGIPISSNCVVVWKFPADLRAKRGYDLDGVALPVGSYPMVPDKWCDASPADLPLAPLGAVATKIRTDFRNQSIHSMRVARTGLELPVIGVSPHFCKDFDSPRDSERTRICDLVHALGEAGVTAFPCVGYHHAVVFYAHGGSALTPRKLTRLLCATGSRVARALRAHARSREALDRWIDAYTAFHKSACARAPARPRAHTHHNAHHPTGTLMRKEPLAKSQWIETKHEVPNGAPVTVHGEAGEHNGFVKVTHGAHTGWVRGDHIYAL